MSFITDSQTLEDLNLLGRFKSNSVYRIFDHVQTKGGRKQLEYLFRNPLTDYQAINKRAGIFKYFGTKDILFPFQEETFDLMEEYLTTGSANSFAAVALGVINKKITAVLMQDPQFDFLKKALGLTVELLNTFRTFIDSFDFQKEKNEFSAQFHAIDTILNDSRIKWVFEEKRTGKLSIAELIRYDFVLRVSMRREMKTLIDFMYQIDVNISVSNVARTKGYHYPKALPADHNCMVIIGLYHPSVPKAVPNSVFMNQDTNVIFLTGANMAGKSTIMKSISIAFYLAHMGFPVAAEEMEFSVKEGLFTSINVSDEISSGYSHFYAEVMRVKKVAQQVSQGKDLLVIFDELFKGTNVKDAYDATLAITEAFAESRNCFFIISTHIIEVGEALKQRCDNFRFAYMPTVMQGLRPKYTYKLQAGITADRQGMLIIENEGILDIIKKGIV